MGVSAGRGQKAYSLMVASEGYYRSRTFQADSRSSQPMEYDAEFFDDAYEERDGDPWGYFESTYEHEKFVRTLSALRTRLSADQSATILDVGCGNGAKTERLVEAYPDADVLGVDVSERALETAQERVSAGTFRRAEIGDFLAATDRTFDAILDVECLCYLAADRSVTELQSFATELSGVLVDDGVFVSTHVHMPRGVGPPIGQGRTARVVQAIFETEFERVGRERYDGRKTVALDEDEPEEQPYEVWTFEPWTP